MAGIQWRSVVSVCAVAVFVGSLGVYAFAPGDPFLRVLDMGVAPAFLEPPNRYPTIDVLLEEPVRLSASEMGGVVVFASDLATIRVSNEQYAHFRKTWPGSDADLPAYADLGLSYSGQQTIDDGQDRTPGWLIKALLESGTATVIDERNSEQIELILTRETAYVCGPLCGNTEFTAEFPDGVVFFRLELVVF